MPRAPQSSQAKRWLFTLNNFSEVERDGLLERLRELSSYFIVGRERGEEGTPHLQGYIIFKSQYRLARVKDLVSQRAHFEIARGSPASNRVYCSKENDFVEFGSCPRADGHKNRDELALEWNDAFGRGREGLAGFAESNPGCAAFSRHTLLRNSLAAAVPRERPGVRVEWFYGDPGVGKSRMAHERLPGAFIKDPLTKWWTGYMLETSVIIDDFGKRGIGINHLLRWFDRYKCYVETKGDVVPLYAESFIVTSNFHPRQCFFDDDGSEHPQIDALLRRVHVTHVLNYFSINTEA
ncbi:replication-associated protein [Red panda feces-associated circular DNA virus 14]|uniref:Replication-associated protein n=1 Tax=Red panda feces-associated circular DNA virus 14 TaxID=2863967 RepID=A0A8K1M4R9_9VIRU|nr:replication-associated protein [Red panda feces-associated circular DNA virus 14]